MQAVQIEVRDEGIRRLSSRASSRGADQARLPVLSSAGVAMLKCSILLKGVLSRIGSQGDLRFSLDFKFHTLDDFVHALEKCLIC